MQVTSYRLTAANGRHIRMATKVTLDSGRVIAFTERMSVREARRQAHEVLVREATARIPADPFGGIA